MAYYYPTEVARDVEWKGRVLKALAHISRRPDNTWMAKAYDTGMLLWDITIDEDEVEQFLALFGVRFILIPVNVEKDD